MYLGGTRSHNEGGSTISINTLFVCARCTGKNDQCVCFHACAFIFQVGVVLKPLVSFIGRLVACSARISVDTHTHTHTHTHRQTDKPSTVTLAGQ